MKTKLFLAAAAAVTAAHLFGAEPSIYISFDKTVQADFGGTGNTRATVAGLRDAVGVKPVLLVKKGKKGENIQPDTLLQPGIKGKAFPIGETSDGKILTLRYMINPKLPAANGTVSMWVKPVNWDGNSKAQHHFFSARHGSHWLFLYKYGNVYDMVGYYGTYQTKNINTVKSPVRGWKKGEWHHLALTWNKNSLSLYIDGKLRKHSPVKDTLKGDFSQILLGEHWAGKPGQTLVDEVKIYDEVLSPDEINAEYLSLKSNLASSGRADVEISVSKTTPVIDGTIKKKEYSAVVSGMRDLKKKNNFATTQSISHYAWDNDNFYFAVISPISKKKEYLSGRDSAVFTEDSIELYLKSDALYHFIINPIGTVYDAKNADNKWNCSTIATANKFIGNNWVIEGKIPWKAINFKPQDNAEIKFNLARNFANTKTFTQISSSHVSFTDEKGFGKLILKENIPFYDFSNLGKLYASSADTKLFVDSKKAQQIQIKYNVDASMFAINIDQKQDLAANKPFTYNIKRRLPADNTLIYSVDTSIDGPLYHLRMDYQSPENMKLWYIHTDLAKKELFFNFRNNRLGEGKCTIQLDMVGKDGKKALSKSVKIDDSKPVVHASFNIADVPSGYYTLNYKLIDPAGKVYITNHEEYAIFHNGAPWDGIKDGLEDTLPPPWTPIKGKGDRFDCWNRTVILGGSGLVSNIRSAGAEILRQPVVLNVNGKNVSFKAQFVSKNNTRANYILKSTDPAVPLEFNVYCEFDGFMYFTGKFTKDFAVKNVDLAIPLKRQYADAFDDCASCHYKTSLKKDGLNIKLNAFINQFFWCGNDNVGIMGGTANKRGWHVREKSQSMSITTSKNEVMLKLNIVDSKLNAKAGRTFSFYLHPTPVKPKNNRFREAQERYNVIVGGASSRFFEFDVPGYFNTFWKWIHYRVRADKRSTVEKMQYFSYTAPKGVSPMSPIWNYYCTDWVNPPPGLGQYSVDDPNSTQRTARNRNSFTYGCLNSKSFFDFKIYSMRNKLIDGVKYNQNDIKDLYFDLAWPKNCSNKVHGCSYTDAFGESINDTDLLKLREYYLRVYRMLKKKNPDGIFWGHLFTARTPADVFFDFVSMGEMYDSKVYKQKSYYNVLTPELMRIAYGTRTNEMCMSLIPQFLRSLECFSPEEVKNWDPFTPANDRAVRHYMAYCSIYNMDHVFSVWMRGQRLAPDDKAQVAVYNRNIKPLGIDRAYSRNCTVSPANDRILACTYSGNGKMALIVLNDTDAKHDITVKIPAELQKKFANASGRDVFKGSKHSLIKGTLKITLDKRESATIIF